jgi:rhomboid protease GluP
MTYDPSSARPEPPALPLAASLDEFRGALFARTPRAWVTPTMIALNVAVFVAMVANGVSALSPTSASLIQWGADFGPRTTGGQPWRLLTNTFVHIGIPHIAMNMIALWQSGRMVERLLGNLGFAVTYLLAGLCGSIVSTLGHPFTVSAGASGAIFGIYGALIAYLLRHRGQIPREVLSSLQKTAIVFVGLNVVLGLQQKGIDMAAHLGGLGGGLVSGLFVGRPVTEDRRIARKRAIVVGAIGLAIVAVVARALPRKVDLAEEVAAFQTIEKNAVAAYNEGVDRRDRLGDEELARIIDEKVLPPWRAFRRGLAPVDALAPEQQPLGRELATYLEARERAWSSTSAALRHHDREAIAAANADLREVLDSLRILNGKEEPASDADSSPGAVPRGGPNGPPARGPTSPLTSP